VQSDRFCVGFDRLSEQQGQQHGAQRQFTTSYRSEPVFAGETPSCKEYSHTLFENFHHTGTFPPNRTARITTRTGATLSNAALGPNKNYNKD
jgi:hypothetical protein